MSINLISKLSEGPWTERRIPVDLAQVTSVRALLDEAAKLTNTPVDRLQLLLRGSLLRVEATLLEAGVKNRSQVYVLRKPTPLSVEPMEAKDLSDEEMRRFFVAFGMAIRNPALSGVLKRLTERDHLESLAAACPGLAQDPMALAFLNKPEMLMMLLKPQILQKVAQKHPSLHEAMVNLAAAVHEERPAKTSSAAEVPSTVPTAFSYHMDDMSDADEEEDMEEGGFGSDLQRNRSFSAITPDQLAAAIAAAQNSAGASTGDQASGFPSLLPEANTPASSTGSSLTSSSRPTPSSPAITSDMFRQAIEQALAASGPQTAGQPVPSGSQALPEPMESSSQGGPEPTDADVTTMKELGISDEGLARKALKLMGGDLQAAIDLIWSGWLGEDETTN
eukprot:maker-scaffold8426_size2735-snap-gene-0.2 protein:Tk02269 transcript:maker-scaffold8426_size2735-snap-gene-0.2-mRNA-1 annotation:"ubiquitin-like protein 7"